MRYESHNLDDFKIVSFDVFDTVVTRITVDPAGIFLRVQKKLLEEPGIPQQLQEFFPKVRIGAERVARRQKRREDIRLSDIYAEIDKQYSLGAELLHRLMDIEIETEVDSIRVVQVNSRRIQKLRENGKRIIFVSDMYLPLAVIRRILEKAGVLDESDGIYVSSEHGLTKSTGNLFLEVLSKENCHPDNLLHIGDNHRSDYLMAKRFGKINACHYDEGGFTRFEKILRQPGTLGHDLTWQLIAGASRLARLDSYINPSVDEQVMEALGANVAGPVFLGYVSWVVEQALARNIQRLYFVARDGQVLYEVAKKICTAAGYNIELKYLYGSRQAWHLAGLIQITSYDLHWILLKDPFLTLRILATRVGLSVELLKNCLAGAGFPDKGADEELDSTLVASLRTILLKSEPLQGAVLKEAEFRRRGVISYLRQEGLCDAVTWALVDSGWNGRAQQSLTKILQYAGWHGTPYGFYLGLVSVPYPPASREAYLFSPFVPAAHMKWCSMMLNLLELLMSADHGTTLSYREDSKGGWYPVLADSTVDLHGEYGVAALRQGIYRFLEHIDLPLVHLDHTCFRKKSIAILKQLYLSPSREIAAVLGRIPFSTDQTDSRLLAFAPKLTLSQALRFTTKLSRRDRFYLSFWAHGSRVQSVWQVNLLLILWCHVQQSISFIYEVARKTKLFFLGSRV